MVSSVMHGDEHLTCAVWFKKKKKKIAVHSKILSVKSTLICVPCWILLELIKLVSEIYRP